MMSPAWEETCSPYAPLRLAAAAEKRARAKCDRDVKLHLPRSPYDDLAQLARADRRDWSVSICCHAVFPFRTVAAQ